MTYEAATEAPEPMDQESFDAKAERLGKLRALAIRLALRRDECIRTKRQVEMRWINSLRQYYGMDPVRDTKATGPQGSTNPTPRPHMTRSRADRWEARLCDMLFPANDLPWDLRPTPKQPEASAMQAAEPVFDPATGWQTQQQAAPAPVDLDAMRQDEDDRAARMKRAIQDQLANCKFPRSGRRMIRDAVRMGAGLLMGPMTAVSMKRKFRSGPMGMALEIEESVVPEIREADPWCFFPDMTATAEKAEFAFYAHLMGKLEVRNLAPGFDQEQIAGLLHIKPDLGEMAANLHQRNQYLNQIEPTVDKYCVWRYTGTLEKEDLEILGCTCEETEDGEPKELPPMAMVDLWFCQDFILRAKLSPIANDFRIPYYVFSPFPADDTMFGLSIPELCEDSQRVAESAWMIALHNASVSSGPIFISRQGVLKPKDGQYVIRGPKWFEVTDANVPLNDAFAIETIPNYVGPALDIFDRAMQIMDEELNTAQWGSPQKGEEVPTASGLAMLLNVRSILQVRVATAADDEIFQPIIERMYWHNMLHNPDDSIKGDYDVAPLVQSVRLVKDVQVQHLQAFTAMSDHPRFAPYVDDYALLKANASMLDFPAMDMIKDREAAEAEIANRPPDPGTMLAQAKAGSEEAKAILLRVQAEAERQAMQFAPILQRLEAEAKQADAAREQQKDALDIADRQVRHEETMRGMDIREDESKTRLEVGKLREQTARLKLAAEQMDASADRQAKLMTKGMDVERDAQELSFKQRTGQPGI